jgi:hypothetical protein
VSEIPLRNPGIPDFAWTLGEIPSIDPLNINIYIYIYIHTYIYIHIYIHR